MENTNKRETKPVVGSTVRSTDIEPYTALKWLGTLFKSAAVFLAIAIIGEFIAGVRFEGTAALPMLMGELARTVVLAVVLWGAGDLVRLVITVGNDIRAERILLARLVYRTPPRPGTGGTNAPAEQPVEAIETEGLPPAVLDPSLREDAA